MLSEPLKQKLDWIRKEQAKSTQLLTEDQINQSVYQQARDFVDLLSHFLGECGALAQEPLDPSMSETPLTVTPLHGIGEDVWAFVKSSLNEFAHLEELADCFVRLAK